MAFAVRVEATEQTLLGALAEGVEPADAWTHYATRHADVIEEYEKACGPPPADQTAAHLGARVVQAAPTIAQRIAALDLQATCRRVGRLLDLPPDSCLHAVTMLGWDRALAWVDDQSHHPRAYFAVERLPATQAGCAVLGAHELAHLAHLQLLPTPLPNWSVSGGVQLEALAITVARELVPAATLDEQIVLDHGVLDAYPSRRAAVHAALLELLDEHDEACFRRVFFPAWGRDGDVAGVGQCGYLVANELGAYWRDRGISPAAAARMPLDEADDWIRALLSGTG